MNTLSMVTAWDQGTLRTGQEAYLPTPPPPPLPSLGEARRPGPKAAGFPQESRFSRESSGTAHSSHLFINYPSLGVTLSLGIKLNKSEPQVSQVLITMGEDVATGAKYVLAVFSHFCTKAKSCED